MDFSIKQALAVAVVVVGSGLILLSAISMTKGNTGEAKKQTNSMWGSANSISSSLKADGDLPDEINGSTVKQIAVGFLHSMAITADGKVYAWGTNGSGQLGDGTTTNSSTPVETTILSGEKGRTISIMR